MKKNVLLNDILIYGLNNVLGKVISIFTIPIYTRLFNEAQFGVMDTISISISMVSIFINLGIDMAIQRYYFLYEKNQNKRDVISTPFYYLLFWGALVVLGLCLLSDDLSLLLFKSSIYSKIIRLATISSFLNMVLNFCLNILRLYFNPARYTFISTLKNLGSAIFSLVFIMVFKMGITGFFLGSLAIELLLLFPAIGSIKGDLILHFDLKLLKSMLRYGIPFVPASLAYWIFNFSDRIMISRLVNLNEVGLYGIANRFVSILSFFIAAFSKAWVPRAFNRYKESPDSFNAYINTTQLYITTFFCILSLYLSVFSKELLTILVAQQFVKSYKAIQILAIGMVAHALSYSGAIGIYISKDTRFISFYSWVSAITNIVLNLLFIPYLGMIGAAITTTISYFVLFIGYAITSERLMNWYIEKKGIFSLVFVTTIFIMLGNLVEFNSFYLTILGKFIYSLLYFIVLRFLGLFNLVEVIKLVKGTKQ